MVSRRAFLSGVGSLTGVLIAGCLSNDSTTITPETNTKTNWPQPRADSSKTAYVPDAKAPRKSVRERWTVNVESASGTPAIVDGTVYLPTIAALIALDAAMGSVRWSHTDNHRYTALSLVAGDSVSDPHLIAGTKSGVLCRLNLKTGKQIWQRDLFGSISAFSFKSSSLYVGTAGGEVYTFYYMDSDNPPEEGWRRKIGGAVRSLLPYSEGLAVHTFGGSTQVSAERRTRRDDSLDCLQQMGEFGSHLRQQHVLHGWTQGTHSHPRL